MNGLLLTWFWVGIGLALCILELVIPTAFVELVMGLSALVIAVLSLFVPAFGIQVFLWLILALIGVFGVRRFLPYRPSRVLRSAEEARTLTAIAPGGKGRVEYEGNPWSARCADETQMIAAGTKVIVLEREGTTLIVMPESIFRIEG
jgi:membrane protein implicated in regulation of membrane protease activity